MPKPQYYSNQYRWRRWSDVYPDLGEISGMLVVDLGCGIGDQARDLSRLGANVLGVDLNCDLIDHANRRAIPNARFLCESITNLKRHRIEVEGIWTSFTAAYFPDFDRLLDSVDSVLNSGAWLAITEVDDIFGHEPLTSRWEDLIERYYGKSLEEGLYRFRSHDHVREILTRRGWSIEVDRNLEDDEFCFAGPVRSDVLEGWKTRLDLMMPRFLDRFHSDAEGFDLAFLECLASEEHRSRSRVWFLLARAPNVNWRKRDLKKQGIKPLASTSDSWQGRVSPR